ncbi:hypothetical protein [Lignipirellula cremea]|uniref:TIGR04255 family protein n=1 Tax=Lignipirellula cremea TaxID=2528010 RepID=A0A518DN61_9BACT|nr:hypothetical protein [Lignipirellula cremea]QDU93274.1 hypothetical protein Pla8534_10540 [Lignipirellula cremea]
MSGYSTFSDDHYINMQLHTEMDLPQSRETVLHFFEQIQKRYPVMRNFYSRERGEFVLEEDKERGDYRWTTIETRRVSSGVVNPATAEEALEQHRTVLDIAPYALSVSPIECESLNIMFAFDYTYRGNHNQLLVDALGMTPAFDRICELPGVAVVNNEPSIQLALDEDCRVVCRLSVEPRTTLFSVRSGDYPEEQLSVYFTARRYGGLDPGETYVSAMDHLADVCRDMLDNYVIDQVLRPLQQTIALK